MKDGSILEGKVESLLKLFRERDNKDLNPEYNENGKEGMGGGQLNVCNGCAGD